MAKLKKSDVERMLGRYDADPIDALSEALRIVLGRPDGDWPALIGDAPFDQQRRDALLAGDQLALDALVRELNELRALDVNR